MSLDPRVTCLVRRAPETPDLHAPWDHPVWERAQTLEMNYFLHGFSDYRPVTHLRLLYDDAGLWGLYHLQDRHVLCTHMEYQSDVFMDTCVEAFIRPKPDKGYMTWEMNCCGQFLNYYIADWTPKPPRFVDYTVIPREVSAPCRIVGGFEGPIEQEITEMRVWTQGFHIPWSVFEVYVGELGEIPGQRWRAQFNKCGFGTSKPHGASWASLGGADSFHLPDRFGIIEFEG